MKKKRVAFSNSIQYKKKEEEEREREIRGKHARFKNPFVSFPFFFFNIHILKEKRDTIIKLLSVAATSP